MAYDDVGAVGASSTGQPVGDITAPDMSAAIESTAEMPQFQPPPSYTPQAPTIPSTGQPQKQSTLKKILIGVFDTIAASQHFPTSRDYEDREMRRDMEMQRIQLAQQSQAETVKWRQLQEQNMVLQQQEDTPRPLDARSPLVQFGIPAGTMLSPANERAAIIQYIGTQVRGQQVQENDAFRLSLKGTPTAADVENTTREIFSSAGFNPAKLTAKQKVALAAAKAEALQTNSTKPITAFSKALMSEEATLANTSVRIEGLGNIRGMQVYDSKLKMSRPMSWEQINAINAAEPGRLQTPGFTPGALVQREFATGSEADQIRSYRTFLGHADDLAEAAKSSGLTGTPLANVPIIELRRRAAGDPKIAAYLAKVEPPRKEFESFLLSNRALYAQDREEAKRILDESATPAQMQSTITSMAHTASIRMGALNQQYKDASGTDYPNLIDQETGRILKKYGQSVPGYGAGGAAPDQNTRTYQGHTYKRSGPGQPWVRQ